MPNPLHDRELSEVRQRSQRERLDSSIHSSSPSALRGDGCATQERTAPRAKRATPYAIPNAAHFIWFGDVLPWVHRVALRSAARAGEFERVVLHFDANLASDDFRDLREMRAFDARPLDLKLLFRSTGVDPSALARLYQRLGQLPARTNLLRAAILAAEGGVYLDLDTVTIGSFRTLREAEVFCGTERVAYPLELQRNGSFGERARAFGLSALRDVMRRLPEGQRGFRRIESLLQKAPHNAVLGARSNHPFLLALLDGMLRLPPQSLQEHASLGSHLLQDTVTHFRGAGLVVHPPELFYPLGPGISEHWFQLRRQAELGSVLPPETRLVHWSTSPRVRKLVPRIDPAYVLRNEQRQLLSALLAPYARPG